MRVGLRPVLAFAALIFASAAQAQPKGDDVSYSTLAWEAHERGDHLEAARLQELAVRQIDRNAGNMPRLRAKWRSDLAGFYLEAGRCDDARRAAVDAASLLTSDRPLLDLPTIRSEWNLELLWAQYRELGAHFCRRDFKEAAAVGRRAEANFRLVIGGDDVKVAILRHLALAYHHGNDPRSALAAIDHGLTLAARSDETTREAEVPRLRSARALVQASRARRR
jgi:hypothetical protein